MRNGLVIRFALFIIHNSAFIILLNSCSLQHKISRTASTVINDSALKTAHLGISIYEPQSGKYWYNYNGEKYFVPASNTKIPTCYAAMKYLGDSLIAGRINQVDDSTIELYPAADPTFLNAEFIHQPLFTALKKFNRIDIQFSGFKDSPLGSGWSWNDYNEDYMAERSAFPLYGNTVKIYFEGNELRAIPRVEFSFKELSAFSDPDSVAKIISTHRVEIKRDLDDNRFSVIGSPVSLKTVSIPFRTKEFFITDLLKDTLKNTKGVFGIIRELKYFKQQGKIIHSQPTDSLLQPMMHRSDNFFAEQSLLMVSNERLGIMSDDAIIDTLLKTDFKDLPQKPHWVDGSGLSRYNLFSPKDLVKILTKMNNEFGMERIKVILPTGGEGTLRNYYISEKDHIYAKTGSLSGVIALSGFLYTKKNKLLVFSVLVNNHRASATDVRRTVEKFIQGIRNKY